jgi:hypothetical protein
VDRCSEGSLKGPQECPPGRLNLTAHQRKVAIRRLADGVAQADVARTYGVSQATISRLAAPSPSSPV